MTNRKERIACFFLLQRYRCFSRACDTRNLRCAEGFPKECRPESFTHKSFAPWSPAQALGLDWRPWHCRSGLTL